MEQSSDKSSGISISTVLFVVFLVLKLVGVISWSWWWVTAPIWIPCIIALGMLVREFGFKKAITLTITSIIYGFLFAGFLTRIISLF